MRPMRSNRFSRNPTTILKIILILVVVAFALVTLNGCAEAEKGEVGAQGKPGLTAPAPALSISPATPEQCLTGGAVVQINGIETVICNGNIGPRGPQGAPGNAGQDGHNGADAPASVVKLCPGTDTYPTVFVEYALCLNNQLYAVYSIPNAFMTLLTPGNYASNGIGSSCNLTVGPNCLVSH